MTWFHDFICLCFRALSFKSTQYYAPRFLILELYMIPKVKYHLFWTRPVHAVYTLGPDKSHFPPPLSIVSSSSLLTILLIIILLCFLLFQTGFGKNVCHLTSKHRLTYPTNLTSQRSLGPPLIFFWPLLLVFVLLSTIWCFPSGSCQNLGLNTKQLCQPFQIIEHRKRAIKTHFQLHLAWIWGI